MYISTCFAKHPQFQLQDALGDLGVKQHNTGTVCQFCKKPGHNARDCRSRANKGKANPRAGKGSHSAHSRGHGHSHSRGGKLGGWPGGGLGIPSKSARLGRVNMSVPSAC